MLQIGRSCIVAASQISLISGGYRDATRMQPGCNCDLTGRRLSHHTLFLEKKSSTDSAGGGHLKPTPYIFATPRGWISVSCLSNDYALPILFLYPRGYRQCTGSVQAVYRHYTTNARQYTISSNGRFRIVSFLIAGVRRRVFPDASHLTFAYFQRFPGIQFDQQASSVLLTINKLQPLNCIDFQMQRYIKLLKYTYFFCSNRTKRLVFFCKIYNMTDSFFSYDCALTDPL